MTAVAEYRYAELRYDGGRSVSGTVVSYGDEADIGGVFRERIAPGALRADDVILNLQHDRRAPLARTGAGLEVTDDGRAMRMTAQIAQTSHGNDALNLIERRILRGLSVEMMVDREEWSNGDMQRTVRSAIVSGIALVDRPAYPQSSIDARAARMDRAPAKRDGLSWQFQRVEVRQAGFNRIEGSIPLGEDALVSMRHGERQRIEPGALDIAGDIFLLAGYNYDEALASTQARSLEVSQTASAILFRMLANAPRSQAARDFTSRMRAGLVQGVVPGFVERSSRMVGGVRVITDGVLCEINLVARSTGDGSRIRLGRRRVV